ncbi:MAG: phosphoenolpyruvate carboxykinase (ATP) [Acidobacteriota bacterium]
MAVQRKSEDECKILGLDSLGIESKQQIYFNLATAELVEHALRKGEGVLSSTGALVVRTGACTGRSPNDKFVVETAEVKDKIWWGKVNQPMSTEKFQQLFDRVRTYLQERELYVLDGIACADSRQQLPIRVVSELAWHSLFARQLFLRPTAEQLAHHRPEFTIINACRFYADPQRDGTNANVFVIINFEKRLILIGGTEYAGEMKKSIFTILNYLLPQRNVFPMHCSANVGESGDVAIFFGLSGTGKTTLSADPARRLIGDDEHGWSDDGVFNFEGGCYAKCIRLSRENEPQIWNALRFGAVIENTVMDLSTRIVDFDSAAITENTRAAYPVEYIDNAAIPGVGGNPQVVIFLTCDAFGVLPPIAKLTSEQAMYHFISGYTAKVAGTERGVTEPQLTFSTCFGAPFLPLPPAVYARMLGEKIARHKVDCYLINTGWSGGPVGIGSRIKIPYTRAMVTAALTGALKEVRFTADPIFKVLVPESCPNVPQELLQPYKTWHDSAAYNAKARELAAAFAKNFQQYAATVPVEVVEAGPAV